MMTPDGKRICSGCREALPATPDNFYAHTRAADGLQNRCKRCDNDCRARRQQSGDSIYHVIVNQLGVTVTRVKQIERTALRKLARNRTLMELCR